MADLLSPNQLASQWVSEAEKFFPQSAMRVFDFNPNEYTTAGNDSIDVVWVVRDTKLAQFWNALPEKFLIPVLICDEGHIYLRSDSSKKITFFHSMQPHAEFIVHVSGTLFPLGPRQDAPKLLMNLGGPFVLVDDDGDKTKWTAEFLKDWNALQEESEWSIEKFRTLIRPFYLRRSKHSEWEGRMIIPKEISPPIPFIEDPLDAEDAKGVYSALSLSLLEELERKRRMKKGGVKRAEVTSGNVVQTRANNARMFAWSRCWREWVLVEQNSNLNARERESKQERILSYGLGHTRPSRRLIKLVSLLKMIQKREEKFLIVADRIFLLHLAFYVTLFVLQSLTLQVCKRLDLKVGLLTGSTIMGTKVTDKSRGRDIELLNKGELDGLLITDKVGATDYNLAAANHIIFMGSLYSICYEEQAIGDSLSSLQLTARENCSKRTKPYPQSIHHCQSRLSWR